MVAVRLPVWQADVAVFVQRAATVVQRVPPAFALVEAAASVRVSVAVAVSVSVRRAVGEYGWECEAAVSASASPAPVLVDECWQHWEVR